MTSIGSASMLGKQQSGSAISRGGGRQNVKLDEIKQMEGLGRARGGLERSNTVMFENLMQEVEDFEMSTSNDGNSRSSSAASTHSSPAGVSRSQPTSPSLLRNDAWASVSTGNMKPAQGNRRHTEDMSSGRKTARIAPMAGVQATAPKTPNARVPYKERVPTQADLLSMATSFSTADHAAEDGIPSANLPSYLLSWKLLIHGGNHTPGNVTENQFIALSGRYKKAMTFLVDMTALFAFLGVVAVLVEQEVLFANDNKHTLTTLVLKYIVSCSTVVAILFNTLYYVLKVHLDILVGKTPLGTRLPGSSLASVWLLESFVLLVHVPPYVDYTFEIEALGSLVPFTVDMLGGLTILRFYLVLRLLLYHSAYYGTQHLFVRVISNIHVNTSFVIKTILHYHPFMSLTAAFLFVALVGAYSVRICERLIDPNFAYFWNALWLSTVTMTTVGYGDLSPSTHCGRLFALFAAMMGILITSLSIVVISNKLQLGGDELRVVNMLHKDSEHREFRRLAAVVMQRSWRSTARYQELDLGNCVTHVQLFQAVGDFRQGKRRYFQAIQTYNQSLAPNRLDELFFRNQTIESRLGRIGQASVLLQKRTAEEMQRVQRRVNKILQKLDRMGGISSSASAGGTGNDTRKSTQMQRRDSGDYSELRTDEGMVGDDMDEENDAVDEVLADTDISEEDELAALKEHVNQMLNMVEVLEAKQARRREKAKKERKGSSK